MRVVVAPKEAFELPNIESHAKQKEVSPVVVGFFDATIRIDQIPARSAMSLVGFAKTYCEHVQSCGGWCRKHISAWPGLL